MTHANAALRGLAFGRVETVRWTAPDGLASEGLLVHPVHERPRHEVSADRLAPRRPGSGDEPLVHGGHGRALAVRTTRRGARLVHVLAEYRGSDDLGRRRARDLRGPKRRTDERRDGRPRRDRSAARSTPRASASAGIPTAATCGVDHRPRHAVAVCRDRRRRGRLSLEAYDLSGNGNLAWTRDSLGGSPWQSAAMMQRYRDDSPVMYATHVRTPTLILTGLADQVVRSASRGSSTTRCAKTTCRCT